MKKKHKIPKIFLISSPSGGGEDSVIEGLKKYTRFNRVITTVTRPKRKGEKMGKPYYFVNEKRFKKLIDDKQFIEWARVYGDFRGCTKGEIKRLLKINKPIIWKVDWQGVVTIKKLFPKSISIFIAPPSYQELEKRLIARGSDTLEEIKKRKQFTKRWLTKKRIYDHIVPNPNRKLKETVKKISSIIRAHINA